MERVVHLGRVGVLDEGGKLGVPVGPACQLEEHVAAACQGLGDQEQVRLLPTLEGDGVALDLPLEQVKRVTFG
ncbi:hypothetical protein GCM10027161_67000 [Microbispora hainanensis]